MDYERFGLITAIVAVIIGILGLSIAFPISIFLWILLGGIGWILHKGDLF